MHKASEQIHSGFEVGIPASEKMLITPIQILPAHKPGESVIPFPGSIKALWDTGASASTISTSLATQFNLPVLGEREMHGAGGIYKAKSYLAGLLLPNNILIPEMTLYGFSGNALFDVLIGMDIISLGDFLVSTVNGIMHFSFQWPSIGGIRLQGIQKAVCYDGSIVMKDTTIKRTTSKIGRNDLCHCGSGKKYKNCHGKNS
jgi:hypothetical protein